MHKRKRESVVTLNQPKRVQFNPQPMMCQPPFQAYPYINNHMQPINYHIPPSAGVFLHPNGQVLPPPPVLLPPNEPYLNYVPMPMQLAITSGQMEMYK